MTLLSRKVSISPQSHLKLPPQLSPRPLLHLFPIAKATPCSLSFLCLRLDKRPRRYYLPLFQSFQVCCCLPSHPPSFWIHPLVFFAPPQSLLRALHCKKDSPLRNTFWLLIQFSPDRKMSFHVFKCQVADVFNQFKRVLCKNCHHLCLFLLTPSQSVRRSISMFCLASLSIRRLAFHTMPWVRYLLVLTAAFM